MGRKKAAEEDVWYNVKDARKRKQIQDRLAQRARRQRLRQAKDHLRETTTCAPQDATSESGSSPEARLENMVIPPSPNTGTHSSGLEASLTVNDPLLIEWPDSPPTDNQLSNLNTSININALDDLISVTIPSPALPSPFTKPSTTFTVFSALYYNGEIQGIPCSTTYTSRTPYPTPALPLPLHPTDTQRLVVHARWIDRLPFPRMRDTLIKLQGVINEEELIKDIFTMPSWTIAPGRASWDPHAWVMEKEWAGKWGWLMF